jgi:hypothetical protein
VLLATALAVTAGTGFGAAARRLPRRAAVALVAVLCVAVALGLGQERRRLGRDDRSEPANVRWAVDWVRGSTTSDELVGSDLPIVPYLADRRVPGQLIDSSYVRLRSGSLTTEEILEVLEREDIRAVVVGRTYEEKADLIAALRARYPRRVSNGGLTLYLAGRS